MPSLKRAVWDTYYHARAITPSEINLQTASGNGAAVGIMWTSDT